MEPYPSQDQVPRGLFSPPLYIQRYEAVQKIIAGSKGPVTKVLDIGCSDLTFFRYLRNINGVQEVILLDIDEEKLQDGKHRVNPLAADFLFLRQEPLKVKVVCGDARVYDLLLAGTHVVTLIEVIEHLRLPDLPALVQCVFEEVKPCLVVVTTPNADFNKFFPDYTPGRFRHWDHKFEWTAQEFQHWCQEVVEDYCDYELEFSGCGLGPDGTYCTQMATFLRSKSFLDHPDTPPPRADILAICEGEKDEEDEEGFDNTSTSLYKILAAFEFPVDNRTKEEKEVHHTLGSFHSLRNILASWERSSDSPIIMLEETDAERQKGDQSSLNATELKPSQKENNSLPPDNVFASSGYKYSVLHFENEEAIPEVEDESKSSFYIIDDRYAVLHMRSLVQWVNNTAENTITAELISETVAEECFEAHGCGSNWVGKVMLREEVWSSSEKNEDLYSEEEEEEEEEEEACAWDTPDSCDNTLTHSRVREELDDWGELSSPNGPPWE